MPTLFLFSHFATAADDPPVYPPSSQTSVLVLVSSRGSPRSDPSASGIFVAFQGHSANFYHVAFDDSFALASSPSNQRA
ncbi:hypothetical protein BDN70DRAFT_883079, partial [Pholiota conissans]